jgi:hypothetical protein
MVITSAHVLAAAALTAWAGLQAGLGGSPPAWAAGLAWIAAAAAAGAWLARRALPADGAQLTWDGASWALTTRASSGALAGTPGACVQRPIKQVAMALDLGAWILLRLQVGAGGARWQVVRAACAGPAWHGLRLALRTQAGPAGPQPGRSAAGRHDL